ncbi:MAG TPA: aminoglycoside phosphotransferase family protein [Thermoanaerobaculia bacterium]|nr:aminoglycoside phosphotransferase family protein [Thermoanaerobaculia bacterium]
MDSRLIDAMFRRHGVRGRWEPLPSTGLANRVYATHDVVLRVATDHPDGVVDARTESVAAPAARAAGIRTPRLIAFDDSRTLVDRPFSLWERVHGETLGLADLAHGRMADVWRDVGRELAALHLRVRACPDPDGYLDHPGREEDLDALLHQLVDARRVDRGTARGVERLIEELLPHLGGSGEVRFLHNDVHPMNVMCSTTGQLLAILDWGDAGWGDPTLEFAAIPLEAMPFALAGYEAEAPGLLGAAPEARFVWDKLLEAMDDLWDHERSLDLDALQRFMRSSRMEIEGAG